jgi:hypothetical protein
MGIVLNHCARREAIPSVIADIRREWGTARQKMWASLDALRGARTLREAKQIQRELGESSRLFMPNRSEVDVRPLRIFWEIVAASATGAVAAKISGGNPALGAGVVAGLQTLARSVPSVVQDLGSALFGRGAFDLANKLRTETAMVEWDALKKLLNVSEREKLGM